MGSYHLYLRGKRGILERKVESFFFSMGKRFRLFFRWERGGFQRFRFNLFFPLSGGGKKNPNVLLITIEVRSTGSPRKLKLLLNINFPSLSIHRENQRDRIIFQPSRTNIRSRFQR